MTFDIGNAVHELDVMQELLGKLTQRTHDYLLLEIGGRLRERIVELAESNLDSSKERYLEGLQDAELERDRLVIRLEGALPVMVEEGADEYDMRQTLLSRGQRSRAVRFESKDVGSDFGAGRDFARPIDHPYRAQLGRQEAARIGRRVVQDARAGRRIGPGHAGVPKRREHHSTDLFDRLEREVTPTADGPKERFVVYRTISREKDDGWIHPGIDEHDLFGRAAEKIPDIVEAAIDGLLEGMFD